jgi:predicted dehydrogenase
MEPIKVAMIGLDTSHCVELPRRLHSPDLPANEKIDGMKIVAVNRFETPFQGKEGLDKRQAQLEEWGIKVTEDFEETIADCDAIMMEINDPSYHLDYFSRIAALGKPIFLDKPLAGCIEDGKKIMELMYKHNTRVWSGSSLPFFPTLLEAVNEFHAEVDIASAFGPLGNAPAGNSLIWYGVHTFEMMQKLIGHMGAEEVWAVDNGVSAVAVTSYKDGRRGVAETVRGSWVYGGRMQAKGNVKTFSFSSSSALYYNLLLQIRSFFRGAPAPTPMEKTFEGLAIMCAANKSIETGKVAKVETLD